MTHIRMAGRPVTRALDNVRRYCGKPWSGGDPEVWAYEYFDCLPTNPHSVEPVDVVATAALHPKLTRTDLTWFTRHSPNLDAWLRDVPDVDLASADLSALDELPRLAGEDVQLSLLTKVLHRKRPGLIPILDRAPLDWYRHLLTSRGSAAWSELIRLLRQDLADNTETLADLRGVAPLRDLRLVDIAIWMEVRA